MSWRIDQGDCVELMRAMPDSSIDAVVCDPPYGIRFMGKAWDGADIVRRAETIKSKRPRPDGRDGDASLASAAGEYEQSPNANRAFQAWCESWAREALRVLKPGGHMIVFGGTRTYHRMVAGVEDAGFEIRDQLAWLFGSGFPKSLDVSKAIDNAAGAVRPVVESRQEHDIRRPEGGGHERLMTSAGDRETTTVAVTEPATPEAEEWDGWGTAVKPAHEPVVLARKPLTGTVAGNVLEHGTGALNVDGCRIGSEATTRTRTPGDFGREPTPGTNGSESGRWPANVVLDEDAAALLDEQSGELTSGANPTRRGSDKFRTAYGDFEGQRECEPARGLDRSGASRFFYCAKASRAERNAGLDGFPSTSTAVTQTPTSTVQRGRSGSRRVDDREPVRHPAANVHPTVKPIALMRWLVRLVTPPGGTVLDPFTGSGTTGCATVLEGFDFIGLEREPEYVPIAEARIRYWSDPKTHDARLAEARELEGRAAAIEAGEPVQLGLL